MLVTRKLPVTVDKGHGAVCQIGRADQSTLQAGVARAERGTVLIGYILAVMMAPKAATLSLSRSGVFQRCFRRKPKTPGRSNPAEGTCPGKADSRRSSRRH